MSFPEGVFRFYIALALSFGPVCAQEQVVQDQFSTVLSNASSTLSPITTTSTTSATPLVGSGTAEPVVENPAIYGCRWPGDFIERYNFCANKSSLDLGNVTGEADLRYGVLNRKIIDFLINDCTKDNLLSCVKRVDDKDLDEFAAGFAKIASKVPDFQQCLQSNTEAMSRLCGAGTQISKVSSGSAGLHLNLLNVLVRIHKEQVESQHADKNISNECIRKISQSVHITAALYIQSKHYMDNTILCWGVVNHVCDASCAAFATDLNCMQSSCPNLPPNVLQEFGIWQWYFLNAVNARTSCSVTQEQCVVPKDGAALPTTGLQSLFDGALWRKKMREVADGVEQRTGLPIAAVVALVLATVAGFCASCAALCAWKYGLCGDSGNRTRYSRLDEGGRYGEGSLLTKGVDIDDIDD